MMGFEITENTFVISDSHFGHKAVLQREPSRLKSAKAYGYSDFYAFHKHLWNQVVGKKDTLLHLGDLYYAGEKLKNLKSWSVQKGLALQVPQSEAILKKLYAQFGKSMVKDDIYLNAIVLDCAGERIMFSHFPVFHRKAHDRFTKSRDTLDKLFALADCSLNIHGHIHSRNTNYSFCFNVSCEQLGFAPKRLKEIITLWRHKVHI